MFNLSENFLASFLPELTTTENFGRLSGFSWACAYFAALLLLVITAGLMLGFHLEKPDRWRPMFVFALSVQCHLRDVTPSTGGVPVAGDEDDEQDDENEAGDHGRTFSPA